MTEIVGPICRVRISEEVLDSYRKITGARLRGEVTEEQKKAFLRALFLDFSTSSDKRDGENAKKAPAGPRGNQPAPDRSESR
jgi:hypothetical protein